MERQNVAGYVFKVDTAIHPRCFPYSKCALSRFRSWKMRRLFSMHICDKNKQSLVKVPSQTHFTNKPVSQEIIRATQVFCMIWQQVGPNIPRCPGQQVLVTPHFILWARVTLTLPWAALPSLDTGHSQGTSPHPEYAGPSLLSICAGVSYTILISSYLNLYFSCSYMYVDA